MVTADFKGAEIVSLLRRGVKVTINVSLPVLRSPAPITPWSVLLSDEILNIQSDDPAYFRAYVNENLEKMARETDLTRRELIQLQRNAFKISWISSWRRNHFLALLDEYEAKTMQTQVQMVNGA